MTLDEAKNIGSGNTIEQKISQTCTGKQMKDMNIRSMSKRYR